MDSWGDTEAALAAGRSAAELVPADLHGLARAAELLRAHARVCDDAAGSLRRVEVTRWRGSASTGFAQALAPEPGRWAVASDGLLVGARALEAYAAAVPAARALADEARELYAAYLAAGAALGPVPPTGSLTGRGAATLGAPSRARVACDGADDLRAQALGTLGRAHELVRTAAEQAGQALAAACSQAPRARRFDEETIRPAAAEGAAHLALDGLGMVPVLGAVADLGNAAWYASDGDYADAGLSLGSAVPGVGDALGLGVIGSRVAVRSLDRASALWRSVPEVSLGRGALSVLRAAKDAPGQLLGHVPYGFVSRDSFTAFSTEVNDGLARAGISDATSYLRGSSVGGVRYSTGESVVASGPGDFDVAIVSPQLLDELRSRGVKLRGGGTRTPMIPPGTLRDLGIVGPTDFDGREVSIMVYATEDAITMRGDAIMLP